MTDGRVQVPLGEHVYVPTPQRGGYIEYVLWPAMQKIFSDGGGDAEIKLSGFGMARRKGYQVLSLFLPDELMPEYEFMGFSSLDAYQESRYVREDDKGPDLVQIQDAIESCIMINGGKAANYLKVLAAPERITQLFSSNVVKGMGDLMVSRVAEASERSSEVSPSSPRTNGASDPISSGTPAPTAPDIAA